MIKESCPICGEPERSPQAHAYVVKERTEYKYKGFMFPLPEPMYSCGRCVQAKYEADWEAKIEEGQRERALLFRKHQEERHRREIERNEALQAAREKQRRVQMEVGCRGCRFFRESAPSGSRDGICVRRAPLAYKNTKSGEVMAMWPPVRFGDSCGEREPLTEGTTA